jgi:hypothetical protein
MSFSSVGLNGDRSTRGFWASSSRQAQPRASGLPVAVADAALELKRKTLESRGQGRRGTPPRIAVKTAPSKTATADWLVYVSPTDRSLPRDARSRNQPLPTVDTDGGGRRLRLSAPAPSKAFGAAVGLKPLALADSLKLLLLLRDRAPEESGGRLYASADAAAVRPAASTLKTDRPCARS